MKKLLALLMLFIISGCGGCTIMCDYGPVNAKIVATGFSNKGVDELMKCLQTYEPKQLGSSQKINYTTYSETHMKNKIIFGGPGGLFIFSEDIASSYKTKIELMSNAFETGLERSPFIQSIRYCSEETIKHA